MKKLLTISFLLLFSTSYSQKLTVDTEKSKIKWIGKEITTSMHYGTLKFSGGEISLSSDNILGEVTVNMESISVDDLSGGSKNRLEGHLRSDDFFSVELYSWKNGDNGTTVEHYKIIGGGHNWPNINQISSGKEGYSNGDIDANTLIWNYLSNYDINGIR